MNSATLIVCIDDKATGFELGADDYLTKPFELQELVLRLEHSTAGVAHDRPAQRAEQVVLDDVGHEASSRIPTQPSRH